MIARIYSNGFCPLVEDEAKYNIQLEV